MVSHSLKHTETNENEKRLLYNERVMSAEHGTFTPLVFCSSGGMAPECNLFFKNVSSMVAEHRKETYLVVSSWIKTKLSFALLRSAVLCIRGTRQPFYKPLIADTGDIRYEAQCGNIDDE